MPTLADTTIRLLGQEPLAGAMPTAEQLRLAEILDRAGFAYLEVSGGGCFDSAVKRGVESPWERIRALKARVKTPLGLALRGRFLVGSRPVDADFARRFVASAAENGIDVFRLHDPLNDVSNLREAAEAIVAAERDFEAGLVYSPGPTGEIDTLIERAKACCPSSAPCACCCTTRPARCSRTGPRSSSTRSPRRAGCPSASTCQGSGGSALAATLAAARAGAQLIACAIFPLALTLHRVSGEALAEALAGMGLDPGVDVAALWEASDLVDEHIGDEPVAPLAPRIAVRAAQHDVPAGLVAGVDAHAARAGRRRPPRGGARGARPDSRRGRLAAARRADRPGARLAGAAQRPLGEPLPDDRRRAARARDRAASATPPEPIDPAVAARGRADARSRDARRTSRRRSARSASRRRAWRRARRSCCCSGSSARTRSGCCSASAAARAASSDELASRRQGARRADPRARPHRAGDGHRRGDDRGGRACASRCARRRTRRSRSRRRRSRCPTTRPPLRCRAVERLRPRRVADGRHVLPRVAARRAAVRRGGRRRRGRARRSASSRR